MTHNTQSHDVFRTVVAVVSVDVVHVVTVRRELRIPTLVTRAQKPQTSIAVLTLMLFHTHNALQRLSTLAGRCTWSTLRLQRRNQSIVPMPDRNKPSAADIHTHGELMSQRPILLQIRLIARDLLRHCLCLRHDCKRSKEPADVHSTVHGRGSLRCLTLTNPF